MEGMQGGRRVTLHVSRASWLEVAFFLVVVPLLTVALAMGFGARGMWLLALLVTIAWVQHARTALRYRKTSIDFDDTRVEFRGPDETTVIAWEDVRAVTLPDEDVSSPVLGIDTDASSIWFSVGVFDVSRLRESLRRHLPDSVFEEEARQRIARVAHARDQARAELRARTEPLRVATWIHPLAGASALGLALGGLFCALGPEWRVALVLLLFAGIALYVFLASGRLEADVNSIRFLTPSGRYEIAWRDVRCLVHDAGLQALAFEGEGKRRLVVIGPAGWRQRGRSEMLEFLFAMADLENIPVEESTRAAFAWSRKTRAKASVHE